MRQPFIFADRPMRVYWETTRACDLACRHCRAEAAPERHPGELTTADGYRLLEQLASFGDPLPHVVFTGGDPLKRADLFELIAEARRRGFGVSVAPSATPLLTADALQQLKTAGVEAISLSLDGSTPAAHDAIRGVTGTFNRTRDAAQTARAAGLPFQINTLVCQETVEDLPAIHRLVMALGAARWSLFFLVSVGRGTVLQPISAGRAEAVLAWVAWLSRRPERAGVVLTTTEAPQLRRVLAQQREAEAETAAHAAPKHAAPAHRPSHGAGIRDGNGVLFISHTGDICPSGFLEVPAGNVGQADVVTVYRTAPLFMALRHPPGFGGRCGRCEYQWMCGGSRARAYVASGDPLAEDPLCAYEPRRSAPAIGRVIDRVVASCHAIARDTQPGRA